jgi:hypothetical protein
MPGSSTIRYVGGAMFPCDCQLWHLAAQRLSTDSLWCGMPHLDTPPHPGCRICRCSTFTVWRWSKSVCLARTTFSSHLWSICKISLSFQFPHLFGVQKKIVWHNKFCQDLCSCGADAWLTHPVYVLQSTDYDDCVAGWMGVGEARHQALLLWWDLVTRMTTPPKCCKILKAMRRWL